MKVHVITWHYIDRSAFGLIRAYVDEAAAQADLTMLREHSDKVFELHTIPIQGVEE